jgi:hypothetical protein
LADALILLAAESKQPVANQQTKINISTFPAELWALFDETCHLHQKLLKNYDFFRQPAVMATKYSFVPQLC